MIESPPLNRDRHSAKLVAKQTLDTVKWKILKKVETINWQKR